MPASTDMPTARSPSIQLPLFAANDTAAARNVSNDWARWLNGKLAKPVARDGAPKVLDLFAGCGGLALGFECAGFATIGYEMKPCAVSTYNLNLAGQCFEAKLEIGEPDFSVGEFDVVIGGPPCQPFSQIGYQRGRRDLRDGFPIFLKAVAQVRPKIALIENVRGLLFRNKDYLRQAVEQLESMGYSVDVKLLNTINFGVPQKRERVVIVAHHGRWCWPENLVSEPVTVGDAFRHMVVDATEEKRFLTPSMDRYIADYERKSHCVNPRDLRLDAPSRTVTCRNLGGATSDMLRVRLPDGRRRMLHLREGARLQSFPDWFNFAGNQYERLEQIGNAVAPLMGLALAGQVMAAIDGDTPSSTGRGRSAVKLLGTKESAKVEEAQSFLREAGVQMRQLPARRQERAALAFLATAHLAPDTPWADAKSHLGDKSVPALRTRQIVTFRQENYHEAISSGSYDDVRRKDLVVLVEAGLVAKSAADVGADTNDGTRGYALTIEGLALARAFRTNDWEVQLAQFRAAQGEIRDRLSKAREMLKVPVKLPDGAVLSLSPGPHNEIQKGVIEEFLPRYAPGAKILYVGDTENKALVQDDAGFNQIGFKPPKRGDRLPDIVAYDEKRGWLFLIEAVHSSNPVDDRRMSILRDLAVGCSAGLVFVTAFISRAEFRKWASQIAWETEVWLADEPDHVIHFNGERFLGPYTA